jgi:hypothetical protein
MNRTSQSILGVLGATAITLSTGWALDSSLPGMDSTVSSKRAPIVSEDWVCATKLNGELFSRTELYFGLSRSLGPNVTEEEFQYFVDSKVTPRFPEGLTLLNGTGQFMGSNEIIVQEGSKLLVLFYPFSEERNRAVEDIRRDYRDEFQQESVLRVDEQSCISF